MNHLDSYVPEGFDIQTQQNPTICLVARMPAGQSVGQTATFELTFTTAYPGYSTNLGTDPQDDFQLTGPVTVPFDSDGYAVTELTVTDWGGYCEARVSINPLGEVLDIEIPRDDNDNRIADAGWIATNGLVSVPIDDDGLVACADDEIVPAKPTYAAKDGDGFRVIQRFDDQPRNRPHHWHRPLVLSG